MSFLVLGCQRSGTTMVAAALSRHPAVAVYDERFAYRALVGEPDVPQVSETTVGYKIPRWTDLLPGPIEGERGQRLNGAWTYGGQSSVFIVRDPVDVVASMHNLILRDRPWVARYASPLVRDRMESNSSLRDRFGWIEDLNAPMRSWAFGAVYWLAKNEALIRYLDAGYPVFGVGYQALVEGSDAWQPVLRFLGLPWDPVVMTTAHGTLIGLDTSNMAAGGTDPNRAVGTVGLRQKKEVLPQMRGLVDAIVGDLPDRLATICAEASIKSIGVTQ